MLRSLKEIYGYAVEARDGSMGEVGDFLFDDENWFIRYLVVETGSWLNKRETLISPAAFLEKPEWKERIFPVVLTKEEVKKSPEIDTRKPISRSKESELVKYYRWPIYWQGITDMSVTPPLDRKVLRGDESNISEKGSNLRSTKEVRKYRIQATDEEVGHVADFIVDDEDWKVRYLVVDTRNFFPGKKVLLSVDWIEKIRWNDLRVYVDVTKDQVKDSPKYEPDKPVNRELEEVLYDYYGRPTYW